MFILRLTSKLATKIKVRLPPEPTLLVDVYSDWCAHTFTAGIHYVIFTNSYSLLSIVVPGRGLTSREALMDAFAKGVESYGRASGRANIFRRFVLAPAAQDVRLEKIGDRSVLGSMNELIFLARCDLIEGGVTAEVATKRLNVVPMSMLWKRGEASHPDAAFDQMRSRSQ